MDRERFKNCLMLESVRESTSPEHTSDRMVPLLEKSLTLDTPDEKLQVAEEELAELIKEISKSVRRKGDFHGLLEEMADVYICLWMIQKIHGINCELLNLAIIVKLKEYIRIREGETNAEL